MKKRLDHLLVEKKLVTTRSQAESFIRLGKVTVNDKVYTKPGFFVEDTVRLAVTVPVQYVSRAAYKLASVTEKFHIDFHGKTVLDVGSSTGGFTDFALQQGAKKAICIEIGRQQLHPTLRVDKRVELYESTDILAVGLTGSAKKVTVASPDYITIDVSFVSLRKLLPHIATLCSQKTRIIAMAKPQFETTDYQKHKGVIKNERARRDILLGLETFMKSYFVVLDKADSGIKGEKGNQERFFLLGVLTDKQTVLQ
jgi:23S rRNA (cytidine1920-2'-O)/16S rRNA (cytidine1409-2'-O)-methyltransferase